MMSCAGNPDVRTPAMDMLARQGTRFTRAYCTQPLCVPSRGAMSTGQYPHQFGVPVNFHYWEKEARPTQWIARLLAEAGYHTAYFGKWHQPIDPEKKNVHGWKDVTISNDHELTDQCREFFRCNHDIPFYLTVSIMNPHNICQAARDEKLPDADIGPVPAPEHCPELPANFDIPELQPSVLETVKSMAPRSYPTAHWTRDRWRRFRWQYARVTEEADRIVGQIMNDLENAGLREDTVILFSSDHGDGGGAHQWNQKQCLYEEPLCVPLILAEPDGPCGMVNTGHLVNTGPDIFATVCRLAGVELPADRTGRSFSADSLYHADGDRTHIFAETEFGLHSKPFGIAGRAVISQKYKYTVYSQGAPGEMLVDLEKDPGEMNNLIHDIEYAEILDHHRHILADWAEQTGDTFHQYQ